jgi:hypothetical protein
MSVVRIQAQAKHMTCVISSALLPTLPSRLKKGAGQTGWTPESADYLGTETDGAPWIAQ